MKILICGDRLWNERPPMEKLVAGFPSDTVVIHGDCHGADKMAGEVATARGLTVEVYPIKPEDWLKYGKGAGPVRNRLMLSQNPDLVIAFHNDLNQSRGTLNCIKQARTKKRRIILYCKGRWLIDSVVGWQHLTDETIYCNIVSLHDEPCELSAIL